ncbi:MAG: undecaprenyl-diphosphate phosphatase [Gammaproteobacteria bacterium]|nr:undecaprenyl-diphosphate phosphatase [Gammaproteobacteria bacterium]
MDPWHVIALALMQGLTEFLPISSSAHLILLPALSGWEDQGLSLDVAVHVGTLAAVVGYFRASLVVLARDWAASLYQRRSVGESRLAWGVLWGTVPVGLAGLLFSGFIETHLRSALVIAWATIAFGLLLWWADAAGRGARSEHGLRWRDVAIIGLAQALALIPGTSRSGITITAALALGLSREAAARFSFLLSIPVISLAGAHEGYRALGEGAALDWVAVALGTVAAGISAYLCIHLFLKLVERIGMLPFVAYRLILGAVLLLFFV